MLTVIHVISPGGRCRRIISLESVEHATLGDVNGPGRLAGRAPRQSWVVNANELRLVTRAATSGGQPGLEGLAVSLE